MRVKYDPQEIDNVTNQIRLTKEIHLFETEKPHFKMNSSYNKRS